MDSLTRLEGYSNEIVTAVSSISNHVRNGGDGAHATYEPPTTMHPEIHRAEGSILSSSGQIKTLLHGPTDFLKHLANQSAILACLRWLGNFQIMACIPPPPASPSSPLLSREHVAVPIRDVAELAGVPDGLLTRIIRLTATVGFMYEPQPGHVAHTRLSASFVANPSFLDSAMFLAETAAPAALHIQQQDLITPTAFSTARHQRPKLRRQWAAYLQHAAGLHAADGDADSEILAQFNWAAICNAHMGSARVVEVGARSIATACKLVALHPALHFVVQISDEDDGSNEPRDRVSVSADEEHITVAHRTLGSPQPAQDAAVYIVHMPVSTSPAGSALASTVLAELHAHLPVLRASNGIMLILTPRLLPEPGSLADPELEATARARDLTLFHLANQGEMEMVELLEMIDTVTDDSGKLIVANKLPARNNSKLVVALLLKYQLYTDLENLF